MAESTLLEQRFKDIFEPELLREMLERGKVVHVHAGETIIETGSTIRVLPIVLSGSVRVMREDKDGRELLLYNLNPAESCAMTFTCCFQQYPSEIKAVAEDETEMFVLPVSVMDEWIVKYGTWKAFVLKTIRERMNELLKSIDQIAFMKLDERLVKYLREKSRVTGSTVLDVSHEEIAQDLATSRVVISRLLKKLENDGKVLLYRQQIKILRDL